MADVECSRRRLPRRGANALAHDLDNHHTTLERMFISLMVAIQAVLLKCLELCTTVVRSTRADSSILIHRLSLTTKVEEFVLYDR